MEGYNGKLIIYTQFYKFQTIEPYAESLLITGLLLKELDINFDYWPMANETHMGRAVNDALTRFANDKEATDFLNIDSDESWSPESVIALLRHPEPIICGVYKQTGEFDRYTGEPETDEDGRPIGKLLDDNTAILKYRRIPFGFVRIKKEVVQKYIETHPDDYFNYADRKAYRFLWDDVLGEEFTGMDYMFSKKMRALGYDLWVDPNCEVNHWGVREHKGNLDKYLREQKAIEDVKGMAEEITEREAETKPPRLERRVRNSHGHT